MTGAVGEIAVVGGGVAGWMAAAAVARTGGGYGITVIDDGADAEPYGGTLPHVRPFHATIGLDERTLLSRTGGTMRLASEYRGRAAIACGFGRHGGDIDGQPFHQIWQALANGGPIAPLDAWSLPIQAARRGRFAPTTPGQARIMDRGYHLDPARYRDLLRAIAIESGVTIERALPNEVQIGADGVSAIMLSNGRIVRAGLIVDASRHGTVIERLTSDRISPEIGSWVMDHAAAADDRPLTRFDWHEGAWTARWPLQHRGELLRWAGSERFERRVRLASGNCVAIGPTAAWGTPLAIGPIDVALIGVRALIDLTAGRIDRPEFARLCAAAFDEAASFAEAVTAIAAGGEMPDAAARRFEALMQGGQHELDSSVMSDNWIPVLIALGAAALPTIEIDRARLLPIVERLRTLIAHAAETMPDHRAWLERSCPGPRD
jgi:tryptophan 7-halogenase